MARVYATELTDLFRAYAIQRQHPINFRLIPGFDEPFSDDLIHNSTNGLPSGVVVYNEKDAGALMGLSLLMELFSVINEDDVDCWNAICGVTQGRCNKASERKVLALHDQLSRVDLHRRFRNYDRINLDGLRESDHTGSIPASFASQFLISQYADILITQKWLQHRVWQLCLTHNLLKAESYRPELHFYYAISLAESTLAICLSLSLSSMEAHGIGLVSYSVWCNLLVYSANHLCNPDREALPYSRHGCNRLVQSYVFRGTHSQYVVWSAAKRQVSKNTLESSRWESPVSREV